MSAEAAPQPQPSQIEKPLMVVDLPAQGPAELARPSGKLEVRSTEIIDSPVTDQLNTASSVESLYDTGNSDRLASRAANRVSKIADSVSASAQLVGESMASHRTASEVARDTAGEVSERGRKVGRKVGSVATGAAKGYGDSIEKGVDVGNGLIDSWEKRIQGAPARKEARQEKRDTKKGMKRLNKELRLDAQQQAKEQRQQEAEAQKQREAEFNKRLEATLAQHKAEKKVKRAERKADRMINRVERSEKVKEWVEAKKESVDRNVRFGTFLLRKAGVAVVTAPGRAAEAAVDLGNEGIKQFEDYAKSSAKKKTARQNHRNATKAQLHELAAAKYAERVKNDEEEKAA